MFVQTIYLTVNKKTNSPEELSVCFNSLLRTIRCNWTGDKGDKGDVHIKVALRASATPERL